MIPAMSQAKTSTTVVRSAVARSESTVRMPHLERIDVRPAKSAEPAAAMIQISNVSSSGRGTAGLSVRVPLP